MTMAIDDQSGLLSDEDAAQLGGELMSTAGPLEDDQQLAAALELEDEPQQFDPLDALTIQELDAGSRLLKGSLIAAVAEKTERYEMGLAVVAYLHARRRDRNTPPGELLGRYTAMSYSDLTDALMEFAPPPDPTAPGRG